jgi:hypothetical protein
VTYQSEVLADTPSLYWRLGEAAGTVAADSSGNNHPRTYANPAWHPFVQGSVRTFEMWVNLTNAPAGGGSVLFAGNAGSCAFCRVRGTDVEFYPNRIAGACTWGGAAALLPLGAWRHVAFVYNDATKVNELFINGISRGTQAVAGGGGYDIDANQVYLVAGAYANGQAPMDGKLDEFAVYAYGLTPARILAHYNAGLVAAGPLRRLAMVI